MVPISSKNTRNSQPHDFLLELLSIGVINGNYNDWMVRENQREQQTQRPLLTDNGTDRKVWFNSR